MGEGQKPRVASGYICMYILKQANQDIHVNVNSKREETAGLVFPREGEGKGKSELQVAITAGLPSKVHVLSPLENITHEQNTQLRGKRLFKCNVQQTDSHLFFG